MKLRSYLSIVVVFILTVMPLQVLTAGALQAGDSNPKDIGSVAIITNLTDYVCYWQNKFGERFNLDPGHHHVFSNSKEKSETIFRQKFIYHCGGKPVSIDLFYRPYEYAGYGFSVGQVSSNKEISVFYAITAPNVVEITLLKN